jgi:hypothetical protein
MERWPESSRTRNWEICAFFGGEAAVGAPDGTLTGTSSTRMEGGGDRSARKTSSTFLSIRCRLELRYEPEERFELTEGRAVRPESSASSLISCSRVEEVEGVAVCSGKDAASEVSLSASDCLISRTVS